MAKLPARGLAAAALTLGLALAAVPAAADPRPTVVELFTSQGCSSCPPADALLAELARRGDVLALGYHVDYWDDLGWKDPFSRAGSTDRQRAYARLFGRVQVYTPQLVVDGTDEMVGSDRAAVLAALGSTTPATSAPVSFAGRGSVAIGAAADAAAGNVLLVRFVQRRATRVAAGENARRVLADVNAVVEVTPLGEWHGAAADFAIDPPAPGEGIAVLVQAPSGRILGAAASLAPPS